MFRVQFYLTGGEVRFASFTAAQLHPLVVGYNSHEVAVELVDRYRANKEEVDDLTKENNTLDDRVNDLADKLRGIYLQARDLRELAADAISDFD